MIEMDVKRNVQCNIAMMQGITCPVKASEIVLVLSNEKGGLGWIWRWAVFLSAVSK